jgi:acyl-[acyl-carrier-protein]-phospholipid O-acyltransferase/long-chain-fatty-acid--[acyl-carrier-protein] ligase
MSDGTIFSMRFMPLFLTQLLAAFGDNFLKNAMMFFVLASLGGASGPLWITAAAGVFVFPSVVLSALAGQIADRFDKARVARWLKFAEIAAACVAAWGFQAQSAPVMMASLFLFGAGAAMFGPIKYGILPDHLPADLLPKANAWIEGATFVAVLAGAVCAGLLHGVGDGSGAAVMWVLMACSIGCFLASLMIPSAGAGDGAVRVDANLVRSTIVSVRELVAETRLLRASLMVSFFWFAGAAVVSFLPSAIRSAGGDELAITACMLVFAVSIAAGSAVSAWLSGGRVIMLPAVAGALGVGLACFDLAMASLSPAAGVTLPLAEFFSRPQAVRIAVDLAAMALSGALIAVPSFSALQTWAEKTRRARGVAANNILNAVFMVAAAALVGGMQALGASVSEIAFSMAAISVAAAAAILAWLPTKALRDFLFVLFRIFHRLEIDGIENLDRAGTTPVIALNHVSYLDAALAMALTDTDPTFAINADVAKKWWVRPFLGIVNALPLDPTKPMATRSLIRVIEGGRPVAIFPEGRITVTGSLMKVYDGAAMVADRTSSLIVPIRIDGLERTHFSRLNELQTKKTLFPKVKVTILEPRKLDLDPELKGRRRRHAAGAALYAEMSDLVFRTSLKKGTVIDEVIAAADACGHRKIVLQDPIAGDLTYGKLLVGARVLGSRFAKLFPGEKMLGVMLPNSVGAAAVIFGAMSAGKTPSMINFTAGAAGVAAACKASQTRVVLTSRAFVAKAGLEHLVEEMRSFANIVYVEDVRKEIGLAEKLIGTLMKRRPVARARQSDIAVVLYTSGSEGTPKGVALTHANLLANATQAAARIDFSTNDKLFNVLPVFHSFGLTAGLILPLVSGVPVYLYPSPLHYRQIPELIYASNATIIFGTDTFLSGYARAANPYDLRSIRYCFAGAEPVRQSTRDAYIQKFGVRVLEGYGVTEASPVVAINTPMFSKPGSVGKLMPSLDHRLEEVPGVIGGGRLFIRGPNVMAGYFRAENPGVLEPLPDGWHDTGDIVDIDEEGFVTIKGRAKRFAKIAGEMVSLAAVEQALGVAWPESACAVVSLPDVKKGERLVLLTDRPGASLAEARGAARAAGLPDLWVPAEIVIGKVPVLGSGKVDFVGAKLLVESLK